MKSQIFVRREFPGSIRAASRQMSFVYWSRSRTTREIERWADVSPRHDDAPADGFDKIRKDTRAFAIGVLSVSSAVLRSVYQLTHRSMTRAPDTFAFIITRPSACSDALLGAQNTNDHADRRKVGPKLPSDARAPDANDR